MTSCEKFLDNGAELLTLYNYNDYLDLDCHELEKLHDTLHAKLKENGDYDTKLQYASCCVANAIVLLHRSNLNDELMLDEALFALDRCLIVLASQTPYFEYISGFASFLDKALIDIKRTDFTLHSINVTRPQKFSSSHQIPVSIEEPTFEDFLIPPKKPIMFSSVLDWPALALWLSVDFWTQNIGLHRRVPIEVGSNYLTKNWTMKIMGFADFLSYHILDPSSKLEIGYLAQYDLFAHFPHLLNEIKTPECCYKENIKTNIWFGPQGTISPLHKDPYHNYFCQIVGYKYFLLRTTPVDESFSGNLEAIKSNGDYLECLLKPGDSLYIPAGMYHYVESYSVCISVSFWFA